MLAYLTVTCVYWATMLSPPSPPPPPALQVACLTRCLYWLTPLMHFSWRRAYVWSIRIFRKLCNVTRILTDLFISVYGPPVAQNTKAYPEAPALTAKDRRRQVVRLSVNRCCSIEQCMVFGRWNFQTVGWKRLTKGASGMCGLVFLSASISSADLVTLKFQANKHWVLWFKHPTLATSPHLVGPSEAPLTLPPAKNHAVHYNTSLSQSSQFYSYDHLSYFSVAAYYRAC
jgi:hypothetical protein